MKKLPNAPLQEVIFEVRWLLDVDEETNLSFDPNFEFALGKFYSSIESEGLSEIKRKVPKEVPPQFLNYKTIYQFVSGENKWPLMQLGPGIFTVNDTEKNYHWDETYLPLIKKGLKLLNEAYKTDQEFIFASLRYIDTINVNEYGFDGDWQKFIADNLNVTFNNLYDTRGALNNLQFNQEFLLEDNSNLQISISNGKTQRDKQPLLIWQTGISKKQDFDYEALIDWLVRSHEITSELFKELVKPELYDSFKKT